MSNIDFQTGFRYANEILDDRAARQAEILVAGLQQWKRNTAENLIQSATQRKAEGVNLSYQNGIIARAEMELKP